MSFDPSLPSLNEARRQAGLSMVDLWLAYIGLGGNATLTEMTAFVTSSAQPGPHDYDVVAQALNERFIDLGRDMPVKYFDELS